MIGKVVKIENKLAVVYTSDNEVYKCNLRGKFKKEKVNLQVGDNVIFELTGENQIGIINEIQERKNSLIRPSVANIDQIILVFSIQTPELSLELLDTFLAVIENEEMDIILCINKRDLNEEYTQEIKETYEKVGYKVILSSAKNDIGIDLIKNELKGKVSAFAGPSGVGKSSMLNKILGCECLEVGDLSFKTQKGKNTTKAAEIIKIDENTLVLDTPGFTTIDLLNIADDNLQFAFRDFLPYLGQCKFSECKHIKEPGCKIKQMVGEEKILEERYNRYTDFYAKLKDRANVREKSNKIYKGKKVFISSRESNKGRV